VISGHRNHRHSQPASDWQFLHVLIGGKDAGFLAASPRVYIVQSPSDVVGKTTLQVRRSEMVVAEGNYRSDRVRHSINPWPYVIAGAVALGIAIAIIAEEVSRSFSHGLFNNAAGLE
jgi:hypothetical protein